MGQEIDLRHVAHVLLKRWRLIRDAFILAVVAGLVASLFLVSSPVPAYQATAQMSIVRLATQVDLQDKIRPPELNRDPTQVTTAQRNTLAALVDSPQVAEAVVNALGDRLPDRLQDPNALVGMVQGRATKDTDVVDIVVTGSDPSLVVEIANAWAKAFERVSTNLYSPTSEAAATVEEQVAAAWEEYQKAVDAAATSTSVDKARELAGQAAALKAALSDLETARQGTLHAAVDAKLKTARALEAARTLQHQAGQPGASASGTGLALSLLKAQIASIDQDSGTAYTGTVSEPLSYIHS